MNIVDLDRKLKAVAPIVGVSVAKPNDRSTWRVDFKPEATEAEREAAAKVLEVWVDPPPPPILPTLAQQIAALRKAVLTGDKADLEQIDTALKG